MGFDVNCHRLSHFEFGCELEKAIEDNRDVLTKCVQSKFEYCGRYAVRLFPEEMTSVKQQASDSDLLQKILLKLQALENLLKRSSESESSHRSGHGSRDGFTRSEAPRRRRKSGGGGGGHSSSGGRDRHDDYWYVFSCCQYSVYCIATYILIYFRYR